MLGSLASRAVQIRRERLGAPARGPDQRLRQPVRVVEQRLQEVERREPLVALALGQALGGLEHALEMIGIRVDLHRSPRMMDADGAADAGSARAEPAAWSRARL